jgi:hypothetical protein
LLASEKRQQREIADGDGGDDDNDDDSSSSSSSSSSSNNNTNTPLSPYTGKLYSPQEIGDAIDEFSSWVVEGEAARTGDDDTASLSGSSRVDDGSKDSSIPRELAGSVEDDDIAAVQNFTSSAPSSSSPLPPPLVPPALPPSRAELLELALSELLLRPPPRSSSSPQPSSKSSSPLKADKHEEHPNKREKEEGQGMKEAVAMAEVVVDSALALARGEIVGWFQGRSEFGPRALGARSLLADPRNGWCWTHWGVGVVVVGVSAEVGIGIGAWGLAMGLGACRMTSL